MHGATVLLFVLSSLTAFTCDAVERWGQWERSWMGPTTGNPFVDVDLLVTLTAPSTAAAQHTSTVRGFYNGNGQYVARFMPPSPGMWTYRTSSNAISLDGETGSFTVTDNRSNNHGPVVTSPNSTIFTYADGTPFQPVGTTVYGLFGLPGPQTLQTLKGSPFNKVRMFAFPSGNPAAPASSLPYLPIGVKTNQSSDLTRFNPVYWQHMESVVQALQGMDIQADVILFNLYTSRYPAGLKCLGGPNSSTYDMAPDTLFIKYIVARLASFRNVWWSMSNEWNQCTCKWAGAAVNPCPSAKDYSDPGCGRDGSNSLAVDTPIWDNLFKLVDSEDPSNHLMSIHNNGFLYNYSRPWITHFSIQHTHNKPITLWQIFGRKPFVWDEVKYEGNNPANWGSLSAPQMVNRFWWAAAVGAYAGHGESLTGNDWSGSGGTLKGQSPERIRWFKQYIANTSLHPPFEHCVGDDDGYVHTLTCGTDFLMFHFYHGHLFSNNSFQYVYLPVGKKMKQELLQPWEMKISVIWQPPTCNTDRPQCATCKTCDDDAAPPPNVTVYGPQRGAGWSAAGITVDEDTLPHILTFTAVTPEDSDESSGSTTIKDEPESWLDLPPGRQ